MLWAQHRWRFWSLGIRSKLTCFSINFSTYEFCQFDELSHDYDIHDLFSFYLAKELEHAKERGAKIYAEIRGYGMSGLGGKVVNLSVVVFSRYFHLWWCWYCLGDAYHITQPHNDGRGAVLAMTRALKQVIKICGLWLVCPLYISCQNVCNLVEKVSLPEMQTTSRCKMSNA